MTPTDDALPAGYAMYPPPWPPTLLEAIAKAHEVAGYRVLRRRGKRGARAFQAWPGDDWTQEIGEQTRQRVAALEAEYDESPARFRRAHNKET